jgi:hypothetical protein
MSKSTQRSQKNLHGTAHLANNNCLPSFIFMVIKEHYIKKNKTTSSNWLCGLRFF